MNTSAEYIPGVAELGRKNQAGGYVGINGSGVVLGTFAQRRDTAANIAGIVLANGELAFTTDTKETFIGDGSTAGGVFRHQELQTATKTYVGTIASAPAVGSATSTTSVLIPKVTSGVYEFDVQGIFYNDTGNQSNFGISISAQGFIPALFSTYRYLVEQQWNDYTTGALIESLQLPYTNVTYGPSVVITDATKLNLSAGIVRAKVTLSVNAGTGAYPFAITAIPRTGATSPARGYLFVKHRRLS